MTQWYVNDLSKVTNVSRRTLHHYDRVDLLKPSIRLRNGYRVYSERDLLKLQQIIALKFFGFDLSQIKVILEQPSDVVENFKIQSQFLKDKANSLIEASQNLDAIIKDCTNNKSIPWEKVIQSIEVYHMTKQLEHSWAGKVLNPDEVKEFISLEQDLKKRYNENQRTDFETAWGSLVAKIEANLNKDPTSEIGTSLGKQCMDLVNGLYGKERVGLRNAVWEKGYKEGKIDQTEGGLSPQSVAWLDKAVEAYYRKRIYAILKQAETDPSEKVLAVWQALLEEVCGDEQAPKDELYQMAMKDEKISSASKKWLERIFKSHGK